MFGISKATPIGDWFSLSSRILAAFFWLDALVCLFEIALGTRSRDCNFIKMLVHYDQ